MIETILTAILARYNETFLPALVEGMWYLRAPQGTQGDYITFSIVSAQQECDMSSRLEDVVIQISVWGGSNLNATTPALATESPLVTIGIAEFVMEFFDDCELSIPDGTLVRIDRQSHNLIPDPDGGWQYQIDYRLQVQSNTFRG